MPAQHLLAAHLLICSLLQPPWLQVAALAGEEAVAMLAAIEALLLAAVPAVAVARVAVQLPLRLHRPPLQRLHQARRQTQSRAIC